MTIGVLLPVVADAGPIAGFAEAAVGTGLLYGSVVHLNPDLLFLGAGGIAGGSALLLLRDKPKATQLGAHFAAWSLAAVVTTSHRWNNGYQRVRPVFGPGKVGFRIDLGRR